MKIESKTSAPVAVEKDGKLSSVMLKVGTHEYPDIDPKNERTAEDLRMFRDDMKIIKFKERLGNDEPTPKMPKKQHDALMEESDERRKELKEKQEKEVKEPTPSPAPKPKPKTKPAPKPEPEDDEESGD